jgi:hypothetical protein
MIKEKKKKRTKIKMKKKARKKDPVETVGRKTRKFNIIVFGISRDLEIYDEY